MPKSGGLSSYCFTDPMSVAYVNFSPSSTASTEAANNDENAQEMVSLKKYIIGCWHVEKWAFTFAWITIVSGLMGAIWTLHKAEYGSFVLMLVDPICCMFVIVALRNRQPAIYLPYIIILGIALLIGTFFIIFIVLQLGYVVISSMMLETETIFDEFYEETSAQNFYIVERYSTRNQVPVVLIAVVRQNVSLSLRKNVYDYAVIRQHENK